VKNLVGKVIGEYRLEMSLGTGALGETFQAVTERGTGVAAVKVVLPALASAPGFAERFRREMAIVAALHHPHVVAISHYGEQSGYFYIVSELLPGGSVRGLLQRRSSELPLWRALEFMRQAAEGLAYAHGQGVVHRDVKPENLLLDRPSRAADAMGASVRVADFTLTRLAQSALTVGGNLAVGSPLYMSPEECRGAEPDVRSDVYSLGVVLYEVATGYPPFQIKTLGDAVEKHLHTTPPSPRSVAPAVPPELEDIILRCLAKRPEDRYATASQLASALQALTTRIAPPPAPAVVLREARPRVVLREERPQIVLRDGPPAPGPVAPPASSFPRPPAPPPPLAPPSVPPPDTPVRVVFRQPPGSVAAGGPPKSPPAERPIGETSVDLPPIAVVRRSGAPERRPSALPPERPGRAGGGGAGGASRSRRIGVAVEPDVLTLTPGVPSIVRVTIANAGHIVDHFLVTVDGVPDGWVEGPHKPAQLNPGARATVPLKVLVPRTCVNHAGEYEVTVSVHSRDKPEESTAATARWTVVPFTGSAVTLAPQRARAWRRATFHATLKNDGNAPANYTLTASDEEQVLRCEFAPAQASLDPCASLTVAIGAAVPVRWIGTAQTRPFTVRAVRVAAGGAAHAPEPPAVVHGQFVHRPIIPVWVPPLLLLAAAVLMMLLRMRSGLQLIVTPPSVQVATGSVVPLAAAVTTTRSEVVANRPITWRSRDTTVAVVSDSGVVLGRREGVTQITASNERIVTAVPVTVVAARVSVLVVAPKALAVKVGTVTTLRATARDANGALLQRDVTWTSSDPTVATVGGNGRVMAKGPGTATLTAQAEAKTATADITVAALPAGEVPADVEDCVGYDPAALKVTNEKAAGWGVGDGGSNLLTLDAETDARRALTLARGFKRHCYLGRGNTRPNRSEYVIEYWDGSSGAPLLIPPPEDCQAYDRTALRIMEVGPQGWLLTDGKLRLTLADNQKDGKRAWDIALQNTQLCFIGRGNRRPNHRDYVVQYWKR
jgi:eukaryotic-like serine/threonine-protein kinase